MAIKHVEYYLYGNFKHSKLWSCTVRYVELSKKWSSASRGSASYQDSVLIRCLGAFKVYYGMTPGVSEFDITSHLLC